MSNLFTLLHLIAFTSPFSSAAILNCNFYFEDGWGDSFGELYTCKVEAIEVVDEKTVTEIVGRHVRDKLDADVEAIWILSLKNLTFIPIGLSYFFPNLLVHEVQECPIDTLEGNEIQELTKLRRATLGELLIDRIPDDYFATNLDLESVYIFNNTRLKIVGENMLNSLSNLTYVGFEGNFCHDQTALGSSEISTLIQILRQNCRDVLARVKQLERKQFEMSNIMDIMKEENRVLKQSLENLKSEITFLKNLIERITESM